MIFFRKIWQLNRKMICLVFFLALAAASLIIWTGNYTSSASGLLQLLEANLLLPVFALSAGFLAAFCPSFANPCLRTRITRDKWLIDRFYWLALTAVAASGIFSLLGEILFALQGQVNPLSTYFLTALLLFQAIMAIQTVIFLISLLLPMLSFRLINCLACILAWLYFMSAFSKNYLEILTGWAFVNSPLKLACYLLIAWGSILLLWLLASQLIREKELL